MMQSRPLFRSLFCFAFLIALLSPRLANAQNLAPFFAISGGTTTFNGAKGNSAGYSFTVTGTKTVAALGFWDEGGDGLANSHGVGLWTDAGSLLTSVNVTNTSGTIYGSADGNWRTELITPLVLKAGVYRLGTFYNGNDADAIRYHLFPTESEGVTVNDCYQIYPVSGLTFPNSLLVPPGKGLYGPMAFSSAPEASTAFLLAGGFGILGLITKRQRRTTAG